MSSIVELMLELLETESITLYTFIWICNLFTKLLVYPHPEILMSLSVTLTFEDNGKTIETLYIKGIWIDLQTICAYI